MSRATGAGDLGNWSDRISSIRTFGGTTAVVYRDSGFRGASFVVNGDVLDLARVPGQGVRTWDRQSVTAASIISLHPGSSSTRL
jgi:hypothetical protein